MGLQKESQKAPLQPDEELNPTTYNINAKGEWRSVKLMKIKCVCTPQLSAVNAP